MITDERHIQTLIDRLKEGDDAAFDELFHHFKRPIFFVALRMVSNQDDADEMVQKTFMQAYINIKNFRGESSFKTWLYRIAMNACKDHLKSKEHRAIKIDLESPSMRGLKSTFDHPIKKMIRQDQKKVIIDRMKNLSSQQKTTVVLRVFEDMAFKEIARILECKESTAKVHYHQAILKLKDEFKEDAKGDFI
ncbi:MAG: hypothetical protein A3B70_03110 [Deltaproteobacteria bacterium RIFCSPHIGHO2_02_FULL_40_11]|nr:MAG: hypothetical protein A3B70_03110 [Deltaproteobacteria bacterium RIFCSPHIGHO2_02_FULL_40_11]